MSRTTAIVPIPTREFVREDIANRFETDSSVMLSEPALSKLVAQFPTNADASEILLKVVAINQLYHTQIFAVHEVARVISQADIDPRLAVGDPNIIEAIGKVEISGKTRYNYSFASKYCSWHRPEFYPIYDSFVEEALCCYQRQFGLSYKRTDLWVYESFRNAVIEFRDRFGLQSLGFKEIDKFLWLCGQDISNEKAQRKYSSAEAIESETRLPDLANETATA
jgi:hypothetical protein